MGLFDRLFGGRRKDAELASAEVDRSLALDRLGSTPAGNAEPRAAVAPPNDPASSSPRVAARLRPYVPIPPGRPPRSWLGGHPRLPEPFAWPRGDSEPFRFVAQIDCSELPDGVWQGAGPRRGWLAFFVGTRKGRVAAEVVQAATLGPERAAPAPWRRDDMHLEPYGDAPDDWRYQTPCWPVEVIAQREDEPDIWRAWSQKRGSAEQPTPYGEEEVDLSRAEYQPYDWETLRMLVGVMRKKAADRKQAALGALNRAIGAQNAPAPNQAIPAMIRSEAVALAEQFAQLDRSRPYDPEVWVPFAQAASRWRKLSVERELDRNEPLGHVASRTAHYADSLIRVSARTGRPGTTAYQQLLASREPCFALWRAINADDRLPPATVQRSTNYEGFRIFRAEQPAVWSEYADRLKASFGALSDLEAALRLRYTRDDSYGFGSGYRASFPDSWDEAAAQLQSYLATSEREAAATTAKQPDRSPEVAHAQAQLAEIEGAERTLATLAESVAAAERGGAPFDWGEWRPQVEALMPPHAFDRRRVLLRYNQLRSDLAARAYTRDPATALLPEPVRTYFLARWAFDAAFEIACVGGPNHGYTEIVEPEDDGTDLLLELPTSTLFGWSWGDMDHLVVAIRHDALRRGDFGKAVAGITNGLLG
jgi:hypothetical protein